MFKEKMSLHSLHQQFHSSPESAREEREDSTHSMNNGKTITTVNSSFSPLTPTTKYRREFPSSKLVWGSPHGRENDDGGSKERKSSSTISSSPISERIRNLKLHSALLRSPNMSGEKNTTSPREDTGTLSSVSTQSRSKLDNLDDHFTPSLFCKLISYEELHSTQGSDQIVCSSVETIEFPELSIRHKVLKDENKTLFDYPPEVSLLQCASGLDHYIFVFSNGSVYVLGSNQNGEIGLGYEVEGIEGIYAHKNRFFDIEKKRGCLRVTCGASHSIFECEDGNIYGCGSNEMSQLSCHVKTSEDWISPKTCIYEPTKLLINGPVKVLGAHATMSYFFPIRVCGPNMHGNIGPRQRASLVDLQALMDNLIFKPLNNNSENRGLVIKSFPSYIGATETTTWFTFEREYERSTVMDIFAIEKGVMRCILTLQDPSFLRGMACTKQYPLLHVYDKKTNSEGLIVPLDLAKKLKKGPWRSIATNFDETVKLTFVSFSSLAQPIVKITKVETCPFNNVIILHEEGGNTIWVSKESTFKSISAQQFLTEECFSLGMNVTCSQSRMLIYLK
ncbi:hypothetical protein C9374_008155 [Naegleria lovaniensis]|uniref:Uncharacterized protein n=1 Tax=Naegleria lovaniensis TaxID=51637 RepID=A0AA88GL43_NAELO|nr:uncharacterized protein C9374_008155 [Naegleria lovaniensis]KAG2378516.1 hypothetical protein C9374_008155 [Naegleria lovaniensis]